MRHASDKTIHHHWGQCTNCYAEQSRHLFLHKAIREILPPRRLVKVYHERSRPPTLYHDRSNTVPSNSAAIMCA